VKNLFSVEGKVVLVTGGGRGVGRGISERFLSAGAEVLICGRSEPEWAVEAGDHKAEFMAADVRDVEQLQALVDHAAERFGRLDVLVNNAGITAPTPIKDLDALDFDDWDRVFAVNVRGLVQVTKAAAPMLKAAQGCVVNTASIVGLRPGPQPLAYSASKASVVSLTKTLALALSPEVRVNAVAPGWMEGDWMERMLGDNYDRLMERRARMTPLKRCVTADDVAQSMLSLIAGNRFVTGEIVVVDGGFASST